MRKLFGYFRKWNIKDHRGEYPYEDDGYKYKFIWNYHAPNWMHKWFEGISFDNIYYGTPEDAYDKRTCLIFHGADNLYWIFFRQSPVGVGDWKWCLKFKKWSNDHVCCG